MNKKLVNHYIMQCIDLEPYLGNHSLSDTEQLQELFNIFESEYLYENNLKRYGTQVRCFQEWIAGLPTVFDVDFTNFGIWNKAIELQILKPDPTDKQIENLLQRWFHIIAQSTFMLMRKHGIKGLK